MAGLIVVLVLIVLGAGVCGFLAQPSFGRLPSGERLERIRMSPNYRDGAFRNRVPTPMMTGEKNRWRILAEFIFSDRRGLRPERPVAVVRPDLKHLPDSNLMVWFGHSSYLLQIDGRRILVDPVFRMASPVSFVNRPFAGTDVFRPEDMPDIDLLIITHDHWDHLDYKTVKALRNRIRKVVCPLGVGAHLEYWGYDPDRLCELDWDEQTEVEGLVVHCLPTRHFSGRGLASNRTLWGSFLVEAPSLSAFIGGDGGYGPHFEEIGRRFPKIDWAILENGQYSENWKFIHTMPCLLGKAAADLRAKQVVTVHHSKYALSSHPWDEPLKNARDLKSSAEASVSIPSIGEILFLTGGERMVECASCTGAGR